MERGLTHIFRFILDKLMPIIIRKELIIVVPKRRYYFYILDLHLHFFPDRFLLINLMG